MDQKLSISIASLVFAGGVAVGVTGMKLQPTQAPVVSEVLIKTDVLKTATVECLTAVKAVCPSTDKDCTTVGLNCTMETVVDGSKCSKPHIVATAEQVVELDKDGRETGRVQIVPTQRTEPGDCKNAEVTGWVCNGAYMGPSEQACLNEAAKAETVGKVIDPVAEEVLEP